MSWVSKALEREYRYVMIAARLVHLMGSMNANETLVSQSMLDSLVCRVGGFADLLAYAASCYEGAPLGDETAETTETETAAPISGRTVRA